MAGISLLAVDVGHQLERRRLAARRAARPAIASRRSRTSARLPSMWPRRSVNGRPCPDSVSRTSSALDAVQRGEELAHRVGRPAVVEVERDPAQHVVAGQQQAALGLVQHDVRRRVTRRLDARSTCRGRSPRSRRAAGRGRAPAARSCRCRRRGALPPTPAAGPRARRSDARPRSGARARPPGRRARGQVLVARVDPQLAAGPLLDRGGLAAVVDVGVGADEQPTSARAAARPARARARGGAASRAVSIPQSTSTIPSPAASAQALQCGTPGQREREPQPPHAGERRVRLARPRSAASASASARTLTCAHGRRRQVHVRAPAARAPRRRSAARGQRRPSRSPTASGASAAACRAR